MNDSSDTSETINTSIVLNTGSADIVTRAPFTLSITASAQLKYLMRLICVSYVTVHTTSVNPRYNSQVLVHPYLSCWHFRCRWL